MEQYNQSVIDACFRRARVSGMLSASSIAKYRDSLKKFFHVIQKDFRELIAEDFEEFVIRMQDSGAGNSRIANVISSVVWVIRDAQMSSGLFPGIDLGRIRKPKIGKREVDYLTMDELSQFFACLDGDIRRNKTMKKVRAKALFLTLFQTGARIGEVLSIDRERIDRQNMEVAIIGKGNKPRTLILTPETLQILDAYIGMRNDTHPALFTALNGVSRWKQTDVGRTLRRYRRLSGIQKRFTIHTFRHSFATHHLFNGASLTVVQAALGHSDPMTTLRYYAGAANKQQVRRMVNDNNFDFIPKSAIQE